MKRMMKGFDDADDDDGEGQGMGLATSAAKT
jgi:hypothetical protein